jgi:signal transduction histidine kinase/ligand-binding sensor domain-containing protein/CheY-like chemotaxis protein
MEKMITIRREVALIFLLLINFTVYAVDVSRFEHIGVRDGLSHNTVRCIMQDSQGFMWFGTINGLNRYDGKKFVTMKSSLMHDNRIRSITEDRNNYIWIRTMTDIYCCYDTRLEQFVDYAPENKLKEFSRILLASNGDVWLWGGNDGCCRVRYTADGFVSRLLSENELGSKRINSVYEDSLHNIWITTQNGLYRVDNNIITKISGTASNYVHEYGGYLFFVEANARKIEMFSLKENVIIGHIDFPTVGNLSLYSITSVSDSLIFITCKKNIMVFNAASRCFVAAEPFFDGERVHNATFFDDNKNCKWLFNRSGHIWGQIDDSKFTKIRLIPDSILATIDVERYEILRDSRGIIWISTYGNGLFAIEGSNKITHFTKSNSKLPTNYLLSICEDKSGEIWVGAEFSGACKLSMTNFPFRIVKPAPATTNELENSVRLIFEDSRNRFWLGTRDGNLHVVDSGFKKITNIKIDEGLPYCMTEDARHNIWLGTRGGGIYVFPADSFTPRRYSLEDELDTNGNSIFGLWADSKQRLWAASFGGGLLVADLNKPNISFRNIITRKSNLDRLRYIIQDRTGIIWVGSNVGIVAFDPDLLMIDNTKYITFISDINNPKSLNNNEVKTIFEDSRGRLWFGTTGGGLNLLVRENPLENSWFKHFSAESGLSNVIIQAINEDNEGNIWVSAEGGTGISKLNYQTETFENYDFSNYRQDGLFNEIACWKRANGELLFGASLGVYIFQPSEIQYNSYTPPVLLTGLKIDGADVLPASQNSPLKQSISMTDAIELKHNQNSFNIEFAMPNFHSPDYNQYTYCLDNYEKTWNPASRHNVAVYRNVPAGKYVFRVRASNSFGVWNEQETTLQITVAPPFWKTSWAYMVYFLTSCAVAFFVFKIALKINRLHNEVEVEKQLTEYKLRFFTNISHEFRTPLTIIKGSIDNLSQAETLPPDFIKKQIVQLSKGSSRLMRLIDQLLLFRKLRSDKLELHTEHTEAVMFFREMFQHFEELMQRKSIDFRFVSNKENCEMLLDKNIWDKITYNFLSNAIKHTPEGGKIQLQLDFCEQEDRFRLSVSDSGAGVPPDKQSSLFVRFAQLDTSIGGTGVGLHLSAELATVHKGKAEYEKSEFGGACFSVSIPLAEHNYLMHERAKTSQHEEDTPPVPDDLEILSALEVSGNANAHCKILIVEDDDEVRDFVASQLAALFNLVTAKNGEEGLEQAISEQPDLIICDVMMPKMDGYELTRRLKNNFDTSHIPIILLTAHTSEEHQIEGITAGADAYVTKPFSHKYLIARITKLIEQREKLRKKFAQSPGKPEITVPLIDRDKDFLEKIHKIIDENIGNEDFSIEVFAQKMNLSRSLFFRKVKGLTGYSPNEYINVIRMKHAAEMLLVQDKRIAEISYAVGIYNPLYFTRLFTKQFGISPTHYRKEMQKQLILHKIIR